MRKHWTYCQTKGCFPCRASRRLIDYVCKDKYIDIVQKMAKEEWEPSFTEKIDWTQQRRAETMKLPFIKTKTKMRYWAILGARSKKLNNFITRSFEY